MFGELFLSEVLRHPVLDLKGEELGKLKDVVVVKAEPLPKADAVIIERKGELSRIPWSEFTMFNKRIIAARIFAADLVPYDETVN